MPKEHHALRTRTNPRPADGVATRCGGGLRKPGAGADRDLAAGNRNGQCRAVPGAYQYASACSNPILNTNIGAGADANLASFTYSAGKSDVAAYPYRRTYRDAGAGTTHAHATLAAVGLP